MARNAVTQRLSKDSKGVTYGYRPQAVCLGNVRRNGGGTKLRAVLLCEVREVGVRPGDHRRSPV